jgi:hypothetical protein
MNRRAMMVMGVAASVAPLLPAGEAQTLSTIWSAPHAPGGFELLARLGALGYDLRKQYVANLRALGEPKITEIVDLIEDMNERGLFA